MSISKTGVIYTVLDAMLDTRVSILAQIDENLASEVLKGSSYHTRIEDSFPGVSHADFKEHYQQRNEFVLSQSFMTNIFVVYKHLFKTILQEEAMTPFHGKLKLVVNTYPYTNLSVEEKEALSAAIFHNIGKMAEVELIEMSDEELTPSHCKDHYRFMVMYEYANWMNVQTDAFHRVVMPEVAVIAPAIYHAGAPTESERQESMRELKRFFPGMKSPFEAPERLSSMLINLQLIDVWYFSIVSDFSQTAQNSTLPDIATLVKGAVSEESTSP